MSDRPFVKAPETTDFASLVRVSLILSLSIIVRKRLKAVYGLNDQ
jgi:hypothetical protein